MRWSALEKHEREALEKLKAKRGKAKVLDDFTDPFPGWSWVLEVFFELGTDRQVGMGVGPIPAASLDRYADRHGLTPDEEEEFRTLIRRLDTAYLDFHASRREKKAPSAPPPRPHLRGRGARRG